MGQDTRPTLSRDHVVDSAVALADQEGIDSLTIRGLASAMGTKPMTIYRHVPSKEAIIDGMVDRVFGEIQRPSADGDWIAELRRRCESMRSALRRHPWAPPLMEARTSPGPETLGHHDAVIACVRGAGLDWPMVAHAIAMLDAFVYGFAITEQSLPDQVEGEFVGAARDIAEGIDADAYPHLMAFAVEHVFAPGYDYTDSFAFGLDRILDAVADLADG